MKRKRSVKGNREEGTRRRREGRREVNKERRVRGVKEEEEGGRREVCEGWWRGGVRKVEGWRRESRRVECSEPGSVRQIGLMLQDATFCSSHMVVFFKGRKSKDRFTLHLTCVTSIISLNYSHLYVHFTSLRRSLISPPLTSSLTSQHISPCISLLTSYPSFLTLPSYHISPHTSPPTPLFSLSPLPSHHPSPYTSFLSSLSPLPAFLPSPLPLLFPLAAVSSGRYVPL